ncbi:MAG: hypothetical protein IPO92_02405 [Saprospiraceae bacterium]|nr:hypothetical protein [Saprospiraceae bacterium]
MPVIGLVLDEGMAPQEDIFKSIVSYVYKIFNTIRYHSDKDFLRKNNFYKKFCVRNINVSGFGWLNFAMEDEEKKDLFYKV